MNTTAQITSVPIGELRIDESNPRKLTVESDTLASLTASIEKRGIIQPLLVRPNDDGGGYLIVAGQRRYLAANIAGLDELPVYIRDVNGDAAALGLVENMERLQLTPIEEANAFKRAVDGGMTTAELADAIGRSEQLVKDRLALLELPEKVQAKVGAGELTLRAAAALPKIMVAGNQLVEKAVELVTTPKKERWEEPLTVADLEEDPGMVLEEALDAIPMKDRPFLVQVRKGVAVSLDDQPWPKTVDLKALKAKLATVPNDYDRKTYKRLRSTALEITTDDLDAARAFSCLLELAGKHNSTSWITDPVWLADRLDVKIDKTLASLARKQNAAAKKAGEPTAPAAGPDIDGEKARREAAREANAKERAATLAKREKNITLGIALYKGLHAPAITTDAMRLLGELFAEYAGEDLGRCGLRFIDEESQTVETLKNGTVKNVKHLKGTGEIEKLFTARLAKATTAEQILGVILQAVIAAKHASREAVGQNDRHGSVQGLGIGYGARNKTLIELVEKIAAPVLPAGAAKKTRKRTTATTRARNP